MTNAEIQKLFKVGKQIIDYYGIDYKLVKNSRLKKTLGYCWYNRKEIHLSTMFLKYGNYAEAYDTVLHEIGHALAPRGSHHNHNWKDKCRNLGIMNPRRCCKSFIDMPSKYSLICDKCGTKYPMHKRVKRTYSCAKCSKGFNKDYILKLKQNW